MSNIPNAPAARADAFVNRRARWCVMGIRRKDQEVILGGGSEKWLLAVAWSIFMVIGLSMVSVGTAVADRVTGILVVGFSGWVLVRLVRVQVRATRDALLVRGWWRHRTVSWTEVQHAEVAAANPGSRMFAILVITTTTGTRIRVDGIGNWMPAKKKDALPVAIMAAEVNERAYGRPEN